MIFLHKNEHIHMKFLYFVNTTLFVFWGRVESQKIETSHENHGQIRKNEFQFYGFCHAESCADVS